MRWCDLRPGDVYVMQVNGSQVTSLVLGTYVNPERDLMRMWTFKTSVDSRYPVVQDARFDEEQIPSYITVARLASRPRRADTYRHAHRGPDAQVAHPGGAAGT